jgi:ribosomal protein S18 acetylase RimI-like enzyme
MSVVIKRLAGALSPEAPAAQQLIDMIAAGCHEEQGYVPGSTSILEYACRDLQKDLLAAEGAWWIAWDEGTPVGLVRLGPTSGDQPNEGLLTSLYVAQSHRCQGIGRRLVETALAAAEKQGSGSVFAFVAEKNPARAFYTRLDLFRVVDSSLPGYLKLQWSTTRKRSVSHRKTIVSALRTTAMGLGLVAALLGLMSPEETGYLKLLLGFGLVTLALLARSG